MDAIDHTEKVQFRTVLEHLYGPQVRAWDVTPASYGVLGELLARGERCTTVLHLVPRPYDLSGAANWAHKQVRQAVVRHLLKDEGKQYLTCLRTAALALRTEFEAARLGL